MAKGPWLLPGSNPLVGEAPVSSEVRIMMPGASAAQVLPRKEALGAGTGGEVAALSRCQKGGEENTLFSRQAVRLAAFCFW